ncbi:MAG TPA: cache domain-containing protein [Nitrososphaeraceae archaeon]|jgi:hypothetical protein|nr:cache domain-containing protein [Nitrososphaeraceae archaeon]
MKEYFLILIFVFLIYSIIPEGISFARIEVGQKYVELSQYQNNTLNVKLLADGLEKRLKDATAILEITGNLHEIKSTPDASLLNKHDTGIPEDSELEKRGIAKNVLSTFEDFEAIFFLMPNGELYLEEPFSAQENLTTSNFGFRGYYKGAVNTGETYLGDVIMSAASGLPQAEIAVPLYSPNNQSLIGLWIGAVDLDLLEEQLRSLDLTQNERVIYVDSNGTKVADSEKDSATTTSAPFSDLRSLKNALRGQSGTIIENLNGTEVSVSYHPVKALQNTWAVLWIETLG